MKRAQAAISEDLQKLRVWERKFGIIKVERAEHSPQGRGPQGAAWELVSQAALCHLSGWPQLPAESALLRSPASFPAALFLLIIFVPGQQTSFPHIKFDLGSVTSGNLPGAYLTASSLPGACLLLVFTPPA